MTRWSLSHAYRDSQILMEAEIDENGIVLAAIRDANHLGPLAFYVSVLPADIRSGLCMYDMDIAGDIGIFWIARARNRGGVK
jgi:hypothetical protein